VALANTIQQVRKSGLTFAPEAGTNRLRRVIGKDITEDDLFGAAEAAFSSGWTRLKLYFMIGLPTETEEDIYGISDLVHRLARYGRGLVAGKQNRFQISVSVGNFAPKPHTPFQWCPQASREELKRKIGLLQSSLRSPAIKLSWTEPEVSALEAAIARGDRRVADAIEAAWQAGASFDSWGEHFRFETWEHAFGLAELSLEDYANAALEYEDHLPWSHITCGIAPEKLRVEAERAFAEGVA
jgi:radical SAM superfamily enzyme YgiQ (UPF0313 family)